MGTWGITAFEDDTALEFYDEFCESNQSVDELQKGIELVLSNKYNMDEMDSLTEGFDEPVRALVYAEIIAKAMGKPSEKYPDNEYHSDMEIKEIEFDSIVDKLSDNLKEKAINAVQKIKVDQNMHLNVLWLESDSYDEWKKYLDGLIVRLN
ncbi:DUF4259 domain-containing protein [uncultured Algibacter sp.]|uniref:DUF4259 domain-containing protein n=1 Tax=uncultured Algibacter sp. TaxID=298659 RepID=UPI00262E32C6|nr:DUF4259 domain-containing protein [uncultured Algibacter sp.]